MLSFGRDEDAELTGCGFGACFCADISLPHCDRREEFRRKSRVIQRPPSPLPPVPRRERTQIVFLGSVPDLALPLSGGHFRPRTGRQAARSCSRKRNNPEVVGRVQFQLNACTTCVNGALLRYSRVFSPFSIIQ